MNNIPGAEEALHGLLTSLGGNSVDEIIVPTNIIGYGKAVNAALDQSSSDYLIVANNDTMLLRGNLTMLCSEDKIVVPEITPTPRDNEPRCFFGMPYSIYERVKGFMADDFYDEQFTPGYFEDDDLIQRLTELNIGRSVNHGIEIFHKNGGGMTIKTFGEQKTFEENKARYEKKWGILA